MPMQSLWGTQDFRDRSENDGGFPVQLLCNCRHREKMRKATELELERAGRSTQADRISGAWAHINRQKWILKCNQEHGMARLGS